MPTDLRRPHRTFTIRQLCLEFKCTPRALRFYEDKGLLAPARDGLNRVYSYKDRARLQLILQGKRVGLALAEIGEILDLYEVDDGGASRRPSRCASSVNGSSRWNSSGSTSRSRSRPWRPGARRWRSAWPTRVRTCCR